MDPLKQKPMVWIDPISTNPVHAITPPGTETAPARATAHSSAAVFILLLSFYFLMYFGVFVQKLVFHQYSLSRGFLSEPGPGFDLTASKSSKCDVSGECYHGSDTRAHFFPWPRLTDYYLHIGPRRLPGTALERYYLAFKVIFFLILSRHSQCYHRVEGAIKVGAAVCVVSERRFLSSLGIAEFSPPCSIIRLPACNTSHTAHFSLGLFMHQLCYCVCIDMPTCFFIIYNRPALLRKLRNGGKNYSVDGYPVAKPCYLFQ